MKYFFPLIILALCLAGCGKKDDVTVDATPSSTTAERPPGATAAPGGNTGIAPITMAPIPNAPVVGTDSVTGSGSSGVGQVMKGRARDMAANGPSSVNSAPPGEEDNGYDDGGGQ